MPKDKKPDFNIQSQQLLDANIEKHLQVKSLLDDILNSNLAIVKIEKDKLDLQEKGYDVEKATYKITVDGVTKEISLNKALEQQKKQKDALLRQEKILSSHRTDYEKHLVDVQKKQVEIAKQVQQRDILQLRILKAQKENKKATDEELKQYKQINDQIKENQKELEKGKELAELIKKEKKEELDDEEKATLRYLKAEKEKINAVKTRVAYEKELQAIKAGGGKITTSQITKQKDLMALEKKASREEKSATNAKIKQSKEYKKVLDDIAQNPLGGAITRGVTDGLAMFGTGKLLKDAWGKSIKSYQSSIKGLMIDYTTSSGTNIQDNAVATAKALGASRTEFIKMGYSGDQAIETYSQLQQTLRGTKSASEIGRITENVAFLSHALHMTREEVVAFQTDMENSMGMTREESESAFVGIQMSAEKLIDTLKDGSINGKDFTKTLMSVVDAAPGYNKNVKLMAATTGNLIAKAKEYGATSKEAMDIAKQGMGLLAGNAPEWVQIQSSLDLMEQMGGATDIASMESAGFGTSSKKVAKYREYAQQQGLSQYEQAKTIGAMGSGTQAGMKSTFNVLQKTLKEQGGAGTQAVLAQMGIDYGASASLLPSILEGSFEDFSAGYEDMKPTDTVDELKESNKHLANLASKSGENSITQKLGAIFEQMHEWLSPIFIPIIEVMNMFLDNEVGKMIVMGMTGLMAVKGIMAVIKLTGLTSKIIQAAHLKHDVVNDAKEAITSKAGMLGKVGGIVGGIVGPLVAAIGPALIAYTAVKGVSSVMAPAQKQFDDERLNEGLNDIITKNKGNMSGIAQDMKKFTAYNTADTSASFLGIKQQLTTQYTKKEIDAQMKSKLERIGLGARSAKYKKDMDLATLALAVQGKTRNYQDPALTLSEQKREAQAGIEQSKMSTKDMEVYAKEGRKYQQNMGQWESLKQGGMANIYADAFLKTKGSTAEILKSFKKEQRAEYDESGEAGKSLMLREQVMQKMRYDVLSGQMTEDDALDSINKTLLRQEKMAKKQIKILDEANAIAMEEDSDISGISDEDLALEQFNTLKNNVSSTISNVISNFTGTLGLGSAGSKVKGKDQQGKSQVEIIKVKRNANGSTTTTEVETNTVEKTYPANTFGTTAQT